MWVINCDGACSGNPGPGGWGVWAVDKERGIDREFFGHSPETTNNQMELSAAIIAVKLVVGTEKAIIQTDSNYVIKGITEWLSGWKKKGWKTASGDPVKNLELWKELDDLCRQKKIEWTWVKGHAGHVGNERADRLANKGKDGDDNYQEFKLFADELYSGGVHGKGRKNTLTNGKEIFTFSKEVVLYPNKKAYLMKDGKDNDIVFTQEEYDNLK